MSRTIIEARKATRILEGIVPVTLVADIDLAIGEREFVAITGPSGSGKSSLLYLLGLLDVPTSGSVLVEGRDTTDFDDTERAAARLATLGFIFQFHFLLPEFTTTQNVMLPMRALGKLSMREMKERAEGCSPRSGSRTISPSAPTSSPAASASAWRSPGRSPMTRR